MSSSEVLEKWPQLAVNGPKLCELAPRGNGEWTKGQHSWNISITKEARMDPEVVLDSAAECLFRGIFFARKKIR